MKPRAKKERLPPRKANVRAVLLSIDSATCSGASIQVPEIERSVVTDYDIIAYAEIRTQAHRRDFVKQAVEEALEMKLPLVVVSEEWTRHGLSNATFISLCQNWGKWLAALEDCGLSKDVVVRSMPYDWRAVVYKDFQGSLPRDSENLKKLAVDFVEQFLEISCISDDVAEALLIGVWGRTSENVHTLVEQMTNPKPKRKSAKSRNTGVSLTAA